MSDYFTKHEFSQHELKNAMEKINGYLISRPNESRQVAFNRAKEEYIKALKRYIEAAEYVTLDLETKKKLDKPIMI